MTRGLSRLTVELLHIKRTDSDVHAGCRLAATFAQAHVTLQTRYDFFPITAPQSSFAKLHKTRITNCYYQSVQVNFYLSKTSHFCLQ